MVALLVVRLSCRGCKFSFLTRAEALEVAGKSPLMCHTDLWSLYHHRFVKQVLWVGVPYWGSIPQDWSYYALVALRLDCNRASSEVSMGEHAGPLRLGSDGADVGSPTPRLSTWPSQLFPRTWPWRE